MTTITDIVPIPVDVNFMLPDGAFAVRCKRKFGKGGNLMLTFPGGAEIKTSIARGETLAIGAGVTVGHATTARGLEALIGTAG